MINATPMDGNNSLPTWMLFIKFISANDCIKRELIDVIHYVRKLLGPFINMD